MAPTRTEHSNEFRELIIKHYLNDDSEREIASKVFCSRNSVHSMIMKYKKKQNVSLIWLAEDASEKQRAEKIR